MPNVLQTAASSEGSKNSNAGGTNKGRKSLRIDLATSTAGGASGLNLPTS
jgi:hypothetical protein